MHPARRRCVHSGTSGRLASTSTDAIDALVASLKDRPHVVLHFHGGLVDDQLGFATAERLAPVYEAAGAEPVFFVWSSGLLETLRGNLPQIIGESVFQTLLSRVTRYAAGLVLQRPGQRAAGSLTAPPARAVAAELALLRTGQEPYARFTPPADVPPLGEAERVRITAELSADTELADRNREIVGSVLRPAPAPTAARDIDGGRAAVATLMSPDTVAELAAESAAAGHQRALVTSALLVRKTVRVIAAVVARFRQRTDHGLYPTIVEEILREFYVANVGASIWDAMKRTTADTFAPSDVRAGRYFLDRFGRLLASGSRPQVTVVGHSAGAVFISNLLTDLVRRRADADDPLPADFRVRDVALLAPACTVAQLAPVVRLQSELFDRLRMFTMTDAAERADHLVPLLYPRSLLYFVSGVLERGPGKQSAIAPIVGMQHWYAADGAFGEQDSADLRTFLGADPHRTVWSPGDGGPGLSSGARTHAAFDNDPEVLASLARMLAD